MTVSASSEDEDNSRGVFEVILDAIDKALPALDITVHAHYRDEFHEYEEGETDEILCSPQAGVRWI